MPQKKTTPEINTKDYRHPEEHRINIPPAKIAAEGEVPKVKKARYYYSPHLSPELRFDPTGKADRALKVCEKAAQYLDGEELELLKSAMNAQQPWLEWAGKREEMERGHFEVDPVALHIHERVSAQAIVRAAMREDMQRDLFADPELPYQQEVQFYKHDIDWANRLILGDSLQVMSSLAKRENLAGKVQMIYIDPPYGIKFASNFQPEIGKRDVKDKQDDLTREPEMVKAYRDTWSLGVHSYIAYLRDRLIISKELLSEKGCLFIQIGDENLQRVRILCDEIFGSDNFVSDIILKKGGSTSSDYISNIADHILLYAREKNKFKQKYHDLYDLKEIGEGESTGERYDQAENDQTGERRSLRTEERDNPKSISKKMKVFKMSNPCSMHNNPKHREKPLKVNGQEFFPPSDRQWSSNPDLMYRVINSNRIIPTGKNLAYVMYIDDFPVVPFNNIWTGLLMRTEKSYVVQTAPSVIERCILMSTDPGDLIIDPTCGSGTTSYVAEQWGRRWITIDTSRVAVSIARQRILTARYDHYRLRDEKKGPVGGFLYKSVPHITLKSIAQNTNLDPIFAMHEPILDKALEVCNKSLSKVNDELRQKLSWRFADKQKSEGKRAVTDADRRRWELPGKGETWEHWQVPFDTDPDWPKELIDAVNAYRTAWRAKMDEVNKCIEDNADQEELVDQPETVKGIVRVSGPFTVEGVRPEELSLGEDGVFDPTPNDWEGDFRDEVQNIRAYLSRMVDLLRKDGVTFPNNKHMKFARVEALYEEKTGTFLHADARWEGGDDSHPNNVAVVFGPQYGPVTAEQVEECIRASKRYDELVIAGFSFDAAAAVAIQEAAHPKLKIHMAHIRPDVSPGMDGLLKETPNSQLFTVFGQPEIKVTKLKGGDITVELLGVDIFDPVRGEVCSTGADKVAAWFLDGDYDGRCFCITQAFFPDQNAWEKIARALGSQADLEAFDAFQGTVSLPFAPGKHKRIAVKVIDPRGNEVMIFASLEKD